MTTSTTSPSVTTTAINNTAASSTPTITIASTSTASQTVTTFSVSNYNSNLSGVTVWVDIPTNSTGALALNVPNWTPISNSSGQRIGSVAIDASGGSNPLTNSFTSPFETLTINQGNVSLPLTLENLTLTAAISSTGKFPEQNLSNFTGNINISGNVGFTLQASSASVNYQGGTGLNTLVFSDVYKNYTVKSLGNNNFSVSYSTTGAVDSIQSFQRLKFQDIGTAYDLNGAAGQVAKILGAVYGSSAVSNTAFVGIGLGYLNQGMSYQNLISLALTNKLGNSFSNSAEVTLLFQNLAHANPGAQDLATWTNQISNGTYTQTSLAQFACDNALNTTNINLTGLTQTGLQYS